MTFRELQIGDRFEWVREPADGYSLKMYALQKNGKHTYLDKNGEQRRCWFPGSKVWGPYSAARDH